MTHTDSPDHPQEQTDTISDVTDESSDPDEEKKSFSVAEARDTLRKQLEAQKKAQEEEQQLTLVP